jgi:hypothetical protein
MLVVVVVAIELSCDVVDCGRNDQSFIVAKTILTVDLENVDDNSRLR